MKRRILQTAICVRLTRDCWCSRSPNGLSHYAVLVCTGRTVVHSGRFSPPPWERREIGGVQERARIALPILLPKASNIDQISSGTQLAIACYLRASHHRLHHQITVQAGENDALEILEQRGSCLRRISVRRSCRRLWRRLQPCTRLWVGRYKHGYANNKLIYCLTVSRVSITPTARS